MAILRPISAARNITSPSRTFSIASEATSPNELFSTVRRLGPRGFRPLCHPTGAQGLISTPEIRGHGIARPGTGSFFWDITKLARNVWNPERLLQGFGPPALEFKETLDGDIIQTYPIPRGKTRDRVQFECPRRFGYNIASFQALNGDEGEQPVQNSRLEWKQSAGGLWYVRSLDETFVFRL
jgi:hypothetical protein